MAPYYITVTFKLWYSIIKKCCNLTINILLSYNKSRNAFSFWWISRQIRNGLLSKYWLKLLSAIFCKVPVNSFSTYGELLSGTKQVVTIYNCTRTWNTENIQCIIDINKEETDRKNVFRYIIAYNQCRRRQLMSLQYNTKIIIKTANISYMY